MIFYYVSYFIYLFYFYFLHIFCCVLIRLHVSFDKDETGEMSTDPS